MVTLTPERELVKRLPKNHPRMRSRPARVVAVGVVALALVLLTRRGPGKAAGAPGAARRADLERLSSGGAALAETAAAVTPASREAALRDLAACQTLECVAGVRPRLGATRFNLPHFMVVGWQKCATTSMYRHLARHPEVLKPFVKEAHFFSSCHRNPPGKACKVQGGNNPRAYLRDTFRLQRAAASGLTLATLDSSVDYAQYGEEMAARVAALFPWVKLVFVMRDRVGRAMSWKNMMQQKFGKGCQGAPDTCLIGALAKHNYSAPLAAWLRHFPPSQVHLIQMEELGEVAGEARVLRRLKLFLGLNPDEPPAELRNVNARAGSSGWRMPKERFQTIVELARADASALAALIDEHGLGDSKRWVSVWEEIWQRNMDNCEPDGMCTIASS